jgi:hypothetical protein
MRLSDTLIVMYNVINLILDAVLPVMTTNVGARRHLDSDTKFCFCDNEYQYVDSGMIANIGYQLKSYAQNITENR